MWRRLSVLGLIGVLAASATAGKGRSEVGGDAPFAIVDARPAIVAARAVQQEPWPPPRAGWALFALEVDQLLNGWVPSTSLVVRVELPSPQATLLEEGEPVLLVVRELSDGTYRVLSARPLPPEPDGWHDPLPPPLAVAPVGPWPEERWPGAKDSSPTFEEQVVELVNQERWSNGELPPLKKVDELDAAAELHSGNMAARDFFAHCDLDTGDTPWERIVDQGYYYSAAAENIAAAAATPASVMSVWMGSSGHRANILSSTYREIGVGYEHQPGDLGNVRRDLNSDCVADSFNNGPYHHYWTQNFGVRGGVYPVVIDREAHQTTTADVDLYVYGVGWAEDMRFSNDGVSWTAWEAYTPDRGWTLGPGNGAKTVYAEIRNGATVIAASDTILLNAACTGPDYIDLSGEIVTTTQLHEACIQITAGPDYAVVSPGELTLVAPLIVLENGFSVHSGGRLDAGG